MAARLAGRLECWQFCNITAAIGTDRLAERETDTKP